MIPASSNNRSLLVKLIEEGKSTEEIAPFITPENVNQLDRAIYEVSPLNAAVSHQNLSLVRLLLEKGAKVHPGSNSNWTALHEAIGGGNIAIIELLCEQEGFNIDSDSYGTPLHMACSKGHFKAVQLLLKKGATGNTGHLNRSLFQEAASSGNVEILKLLLEKFGDKSIDQTEGFFSPDTPLYAACENGHFEAAKFLIEKGANIDFISKVLKNNLFHAATMSGNKDLVEFLFDLKKGAHFDDVNDFGQTPLYLACERGHDEVVQFLKRKGARVKVIEAKGNTLFHAAAMSGNKELLELFFNPSQMNQKNREGKTALCLACEAGKSAAVQFLIEKGADITEVDEQGFTLLHSTVRHGFDRVEVLKLLLKEKKIDINKVNKSGAAPLHMICEYGDLECARLLIENGANVDVVDRNNKTPLHQVAYGAHVELLKLLCEKTPNLNLKDSTGYTPLMLAIFSKRPDVALYLIEKGADVHLVDDIQKATPLHYAATEGCFTVAERLCEKGADVNAKGKNGITPILTAYAHGHLDIANMLIERGAKKDLIAEDGSNPLHFAVLFQEVSVISKLLNFGMETEQNRSGKTPYDIAAENQNKGIISIFLGHQAGCLLNFSHQLDSRSEDRLKEVLNTLSRQEALHKAFARSDFSSLYAKITFPILSLLSSPNFFNPFFNHVKELTAQLHQTETREGLEILKQKGSFFVNRLQTARTLCRKLYSEVFAGELMISLGSLISEYNNFIQSCSSKIHQAVDPEKEFDDEDIFGLLAQLEIGVGKKVEGVRLGREDDFFNMLGVVPKDIYSLGIQSGCDLRAIGITFTLRYLSQELKTKKIEEIGPRLLQELDRMNAFLTSLYPSKICNPEEIKTLMGKLHLLKEMVLSSSIETLSSQLLDFHTEFTITNLKTFLKLRGKIDFQDNETLSELSKRKGDVFLKDLLGIEPPQKKTKRK